MLRGFLYRLSNILKLIYFQGFPEIEHLFVFYLDDSFLFEIFLLSKHLFEYSFFSTQKALFTAYQNCQVILCFAWFSLVLVTYYSFEFIERIDSFSVFRLLSFLCLYFFIFFQFLHLCIIRCLISLDTFRLTITE